MTTLRQWMIMMKEKRENNREIMMKVSKLNPVALGISFGIISGLTLFSMGLLALFFLHGKPIVAAMGTMYVSYNSSFMNSLLGGLMGFVNAFIAGYIGAWLYNLFVDHN